MKYQRITHLLDTTPDNVPRFVTKKLLKNGLKFMISLVMQKIDTSKQITIKTLMLQSDLWDYSDTYIVVKGTINVTNPDNDV